MLSCGRARREGLEMSGDSVEVAGDSQTSSMSNISIDLSQDTLNQVLSAVGMSGIQGDQLIQHFHSEQAEEDEGEDGELGGGAGSSISISRAILHASNIQPWVQPSQLRAAHGPTDYYSAIHAPSSNTDHQTTPTRYNQDSSVRTLLSPFSDNGSAPSTPISIPSITTSPPHNLHTPQAQHSQQFFTSSNPHAITGPHPSLPSSQPPHAFVPIQQAVLKSHIPANIPEPGEYGFRILFTEEQKKLASKTASFTYSSKVERLYIKQGSVVPFDFCFSSPPPFSSYIRAMAIHKQPEMIAEILTCCPKHVEEQNRKHLLFPFHFVRCENEGYKYFGEKGSHRLSVTVPFMSLQLKRPSVHTGLFLFPCFTSDLQRHGQLVQVIFTLEGPTSAGTPGVLGRCTADIRVCASPGRDRGADERKATTGRGGPGTSSDDTVAPRKCRKRSRGSTSSGILETETVQCTLPPKQFCNEFSGRMVTFSMEIHEELVPYMKQCAQMLKEVHSINVDVDNHTPTTGSKEEEVELFSDLDSWLEHLELGRYRSILTHHGVNSLFQVMGVTDEELRMWGMTAASHRKKFLEGKTKVMKQEEDQVSTETDGIQGHDLFSGSPPLFSQSPPPGPATSRQLSFLSQGSTLPLSQLSNYSSASMPSTQPFNQTVEVLQIQVTKKLSRSDSHTH